MIKQPSIGSYLLDRLYSLGVEHIFGLPGDYILRFDKLIEEHPIRFINATRENTAGYMADAYARFKGLGVVCITYGVGVNIVNAMAQAFMESSPMIIISGAPGSMELKQSHDLHHLIHKSSTGGFQNTQLEIFRHITAYQAVLDDPRNAQAEIEEALSVALNKKKPVYIEIPRDKVLEPLSLQKEYAAEIPQSDGESLKEALSKTEELLRKAERPILWIGHEILRWGLSEHITKFAEKNSLPVVTSLLGKTAIDEKHPLFAGVYQGKLSRDELTRFMDATDCALILGVILNDVDTGLFTAKFNHEKKVEAAAGRITIKNLPFPKVQFADFIRGLGSLDCGKKSIPSFPKPPLTHFTAEPKKKIRMQRALDCIQKHLSGKHIVIADIGDSLFGSSDFILSRNSYLACAYFATLGFAVPGAIGVELAAKKRPIVLVGDGAFQISGMELSTAARYNLNPLVILFNNHGYGTERPLLEGAYNDIYNWDYFKLPQVFRKGLGMKVSTEDGFENSLEEALKNPQFALIEVELEKTDFSNALERFGKVMGERARG